MIIYTATSRCSGGIKIAFHSGDGDLPQELDSYFERTALGGET